MKVLVDTNVVLDVFMKRQPFYEDAFETLQNVEKHRHPVPEPCGLYHISGERKVIYGKTSHDTK